jgi:hypothetical protein
MKALRLIIAAVLIFNLVLIVLFLKGSKPADGQPPAANTPTASTPVLPTNTIHNP